MTAPIPTLVSTSFSDDSLTIGETAGVTFTFSEAVTGFTNASLTIPNGTLTPVTSNDGGLNWYATFRPEANIQHTANVITLDNSGVQSVASGNFGSGTTDSVNYFIDTKRPTATIVVADTNLTPGETSLVTITFSEPVTNFSNARMSMSIGTLGALSSEDGGMTWTGILTPPDDTTSNGNQMGLNAGAMRDLLGNAGSGLVLSNLFNVATKETMATISMSDTQLKVGDTSTVTISFSAAVSDFSNDDLTVSNGTLSSVISGDGGMTWTAILTPTAGMQSASNVIVLEKSGVTNMGSGTTSSDNYVIDTVRPTATIEVAEDELSIGKTSLITVTFSEAVTGFTNADMIVANGSLTGITTSDGGITWTATFTPTSNFNEATNLITLDNTGVTDLAGNAGSGTTESDNYAIDTQRPTATIVAADSALSIGETSLVRITFSEAVTGFTNSDLTIANGTLTGVSSSDGGITWTATFTPTTGFTGATNVITLSNTGVSDAAGNTGTGTTDSNNYAIDTEHPTATIVMADNSLKIGDTSLVTITFSEAVTGFTNTDLTIANGTLSEVSSSDGGVTWIATFTPTSNFTDATNLITLDNTGVSDTAGNAGTGTTDSNNYAIDTQRPTATIVMADNALSIGETSQLTITFSEAVSGFTNADLTIDNGSLTAVSSSDGGITWSATFTPNASINNTTNIITLDNTGVTDLAGNAGSGTTDSNNYAIDSVAPVFASASVNGSSLVLTYTESNTLDADNRPAPGAFIVLVGNAPNAVTAVAVDPVAKTVTLTLTTAVVAGNSVTVAYNDPGIGDDENAIQDAAGNDAATLASTAVVNTTPATNPGTPTTPTTPADPTPVPVDGVPVTTTPGDGGTTIISIPVVTPTRPDTPGTPSPLADIPLVKGSDGHAILQVSVPVGVALQAQGLPNPATGAAAMAELMLRIERSGGGNAELTNNGQAFLATLSPWEPLTIQTITATPGARFNPDVPFVISGSTLSGDGKQAVILDARALPSGSTIHVDNVDFIAVVGNVRLVGGAGQNVASGDGSAQYIVLGADDDVIHGGGGNDTVGSKGGDDKVYGDASDDIVFGGAGNDQLSGGSGSDRLNGGTGFDVALQEGKRTDYSITLDGAGIKLTHIASGVSDWLVDVEQVRFATGNSLTVAHSAAEEAAAFLFQQWMGRDLTQSEGAVIQTLAGQTALQVASLFAQVYPQQAGGKTPEQLLEGIASAGAVRVDAARETAFVGDAGNNTFTPPMGLAWSVDGGAGIDTIVFPATLAQTYIDVNTTGFTLQRMADGAMLDVTNVERLTFSDSKLALDLDGHAGQAAKLLGALGGVALLDNKPLVGEVIRALDSGVSAQSLAQLGLQVLGAKTSLEVTQLLWTNVVGSAATPAQLQPFVDMMAQGVTGGELAVLASNLDLTATRIDLVGLAATGIEFA